MREWGSEEKRNYVYIEVEDKLKCRASEQNPLP
jgi:hypothetical protein